MKRISSKILIIGYPLLASVFFLLSSLPSQPPVLFFHDSHIKEQVDTSLSFDSSSHSLLLARVFHNKVTATLHAFAVGFYKATDPVFLFSLSPRPSSEYEEKPLLPVWLFPLFLLSCIILIRKDLARKRTLLIALAFVVSCCFAALFLSGFRLKFLPLILTIHFSTICGILELYYLLQRKKLWSRN